MTTQIPRWCWLYETLGPIPSPKALEVCLGEFVDELETKEKICCKRQACNRFLGYNTNTVCV